MTEASVTDFLASIADDKKRADAVALVDMMQRVTKQEPKMWGSNIIGFGNMHYVYESGREGDWFPVGFSPRKANLTLYNMAGGWQQYELLKDLGKFTLG